MADVHTKEQRSNNMSRIKGKDTKPEMLGRRFLKKIFSFVFSKQSFWWHHFFITKNFNSIIS